GDAKEEKNLAGADRERVAVLTNLLKTYDLALPQRPGQESRETAAMLRSLGYVSGSAPARDRYTEADDPKRLVEVDRDLHTATRQFQDGRNAEAIALLDGVIARRPDTADAYVSLAHAYWEAGRPQRAIDVLEAGLKNGAPDRDIRIRLGLYLAESHIDSGRAITLLEGLPPTDVEALNGLGVALADAGRGDDGTKTCERVVALDAGNGIAYQNLASIALKQALNSAGSLREGRIRDAERLARQGTGSEPARAGAHTV